VDSKGLKQGHWIKKENGIKKYDGYFKDDKPVGLFTHYFSTGSIKATADHRGNGVVYSKLFHLNGKLKASGKFINEKKDSTWSFYDEEEKLISKEDFKDNVKNGISQSFHKNGKLSEECSYKHDLEEGLCKEYFESGTLRKEVNYVSGMSEGKYRLYFFNGLPAVAGQFTQGLKEGEWLEYNEDGSTKLKQQFAAGKMVSETRLNGVFQDTYPDNIPKSSVTLKDGKRNGEYKEYYDKGTFVKEVKEEQDGYPEEIIEKLEGQQLKILANYKDDKLEGKLVRYKENGSVEKTEIYKNGELVK
jgi:antitoxin component YwqK of YwqJK toxin-antitoxin module